MAIQSSTANNNQRRFEYRRGGIQRSLSSRVIALSIYLFLAVISLIVFGQTIRYDFVNFDDDLYVYNTPAIQSGVTIKGIAVACISQHARNWHPLTTVSHMLDCQLYGLNAGGHHATNIILHTIAVLLLFQVLRQMTGAVWKSTIVAALFAVHPLHVESVAWISERKDVLSAVFFLLMLGAYGRYARAPSITRYLAVVVLFAAGLMSKPMLVSAPIVLLLLDYWPLRRFEQPSLTTGKKKIAQCNNQRDIIRRLLLEKITLLVLSAGACIVQVGEPGHADRYTYLPHIGLVLLAVWLAADVTAVHQSRSRFAVAAAVAIAIIAVLAWLAFIQTSYWRNSETLWTHALTVTTDNDVAHNNLGYLRVDSDELDKAISHFESAARIRSGKTDPHYDVGSAFVQMNLADALARKGRSDEAMVHYEEALRLQPYYADAYYNRGNVLFAKGRIDEAIADWEKALELQPNDADSHTGLGNALLRKGSLREAIAHYETALALAPEDPHSRNNIAWVLATAPDASIRNGARAVGFAQEAVQLSGGREPRFLRTLAAACAESGQFSEAVAVARQAAAIATMQGKTDVANRLEKDLVLYRGRLPLRESSLGN